MNSILIDARSIISKAFSHSLAGRIAALAVGCGVLSLGGVGCHQPTPAGGGAPPPPSVKVAAVEQRTLTQYEEFTGRLEPAEWVEVRPRVSGYLTEVRFQSGQKVRKGDVLFVVDPRPFEAVLKKAQADLEQARVRHEWAQRDVERGASMLARNAISQEEGDQRRTKLAEAAAVLAGFEAAVSTAKLNVEYSTVRSPIDGRVSRALVTVGNNVSGVDGFNTLLTTVASMDPIHVYTDIPESALLRLTAGGRDAATAGRKIPVEMALSGEEGFPHRGVVESLDNRLDSGTSTILLRSEFANPDDLLTPGLFAKVRLPVGAERPLLLVNELAINTDLSQKFVFTLSSSNTAAYRPVKLGGRVGDMRIVESGLAAGETVIVEGLQRVRPGSPVSPERQGAAAAPVQTTAAR